jgi:hypothetical protein
LLPADGNGLTALGFKWPNHQDMATGAGGYPDIQLIDLYIFILQKLIYYKRII